MNRIEIDRERVEDLTTTFGIVIKIHYQNNDKKPERVLEVINALGMTAASVLGGIEGVDVREKLLTFLVECIEVNLVEVGNLQAKERKARGRFDMDK